MPATVLALLAARWKAHLRRRAPAGRLLAARLLAVGQMKQKFLKLVHCVAALRRCSSARALSLRPQSTPWAPRRRPEPKRASFQLVRLRRLVGTRTAPSTTSRCRRPPCRWNLQKTTMPSSPSVRADCSRWTTASAQPGGGGAPTCPRSARALSTQIRSSSRPRHGCKRHRRRPHHCCPRTRSCARGLLASRACSTASASTSRARTASSHRSTTRSARRRVVPCSVSATARAVLGSHGMRTSSPGGARGWSARWSVRRGSRTDQVRPVWCRDRRGGAAAEAGRPAHSLCSPNRNVQSHGWGEHGPEGRAPFVAWELWLSLLPCRHRPTGMMFRSPFFNAGWRPWVRAAPSSWHSDQSARHRHSRFAGAVSLCMWGLAGGLR
mmetsp:Transcript_53418/g.142398  ORF Transcript_53418/g.142398 Transcript_53418/m.142398 type:complete len:381 (-) Transcript_53418:19-1161(-)